MAGAAHADTLVINGTVRTLEADGDRAQAVAVQGGRILALGGRDEMLALRGPDTQVIDAAGGTVLPGFTDSHTHFARASLVMQYFVDFDEVAPAALDDVLAAVRSRARQLPAGTWIQGDSLNPSTLAERRFPDRLELDDAAPEHPVVLRGVGRHVVAANTRALDLAGITRDTEDPPGGRIDRDASGQPTGVLHEQAQLRLDASREDTVVPALTVEERLDALRNGVSLLNRLGIVAIHEIPREPAQISDWLRLREVEEPRVRVRLYIRGVAAQTKLDYLLGLGLRSGFGDDWIRLGGMKVSIDGSCIFRNALLYKPYPSEDDNTGLQRVGEEELQDAVRRAHDNGLQIAVHAIGQKAVDIALDAFDALGEDGEQLAGRRHRIEHAYLPPEDGQLERMRRLGLILSTQPSFIEAVGDTWVDVFDDHELTGVMPIAEALRLGLKVQINSDYPCSALNPFVGIKAAVARTTKQGRVLDPSQAIPVDEALRLMTVTPAYTAFEEAWRGRLAPGYAADLIVTDQDPLRVDAEMLDKVTVTHTMVGGTSVFVHDNAR